MLDTTVRGGTIKAYDAIRAASSATGLSLTDASRAMGKRDNYISYKHNGSIGVDNYAAIMQAFGYALVAVPADDVPAGALVVDPGVDPGDEIAAAAREGYNRGRAMREALEAGKISEATVAAACSASPDGSGKFVAVPSGSSKH